MPLQIYINGQFYDKENAKVSVFDHGLLYGDGVFEGMRSYGGKVFRISEHLDRLYESANAILLRIPYSKEQLIDATQQTLKINSLTDAYIRLVVTRGSGSLGLDPNKTSDPQVIIIADLISMYPKEFYDSGLKIITAATIRNHPAALSPRIKSLNYLNNIMAKIEGQLAGCVEALMLNHKGEVAECTADNVFIVKHGTIYTPPKDAGILDGITRKAILELCGKLGIPAFEEPLVRHDLFIADECFLTGTAAEVIPVVSIDGRPVGSGNVGETTKKLNTEFKKLVYA